MIKRLIFVIVVIAITLLYSLYQKNAVVNNLEKSEFSDSVLTKLPNVKFQELFTQREIELHSFYNSNHLKLLVVHFWGTWCAPCEAELPDIISFMKKFNGDPSVKFLLVSVNDDANKVKKRIQSLSNSNAIWLMDNQNVYRDAFGSSRVPETLVFSSDKNHIKKFVGPQQWTRELYVQQFQEFLQVSTSRM